MPSADATPHSWAASASFMGVWMPCLHVRYTCHLPCRLLPALTSQICLLGLQPVSGLCLQTPLQLSEQRFCLAAPFLRLPCLPLEAHSGTPVVAVDTESCAVRPLPVTWPIPTPGPHPLTSPPGTLGPVAC